MANWAPSLMPDGHREVTVVGVTRCFTKLEVHTRAQATRYAAEHGLLGP